MEARERGWVDPKRLANVFVVASLLSLMACAESTGPGAGPADMPAPLDTHGPPVDWNNIIVNGIPSTVELAESQMDFEVVVPTSLGTPAKVVITDPDSAPREFLSTGFVYDDPALGQYWVLEGLAEMTQKDLESWLVCDPAAGCEGTWTLAILPGGIRGVLIQGPVGTGVVWLDGGRRFDVRGPSETFTGKAALEVATEVVKSGSVIGPS
jgi:hypothetical protein